MQRASIALLDTDIADREAAAIREVFSAKRDTLVAGLRRLGVRFDLEPEGTFYAWGDVSGLPEGLRTGRDLFRAALKEKDHRRPPAPSSTSTRANAGGGRPSRFRSHVRFSFGPPMATNRARARAARAPRRERVKLGVNFPWVACGHDFGPRPPAWSGSGPTDWGAVERELVEMRALGLEVVRFWIFGGGVNLPCGVDPATIVRREGFGAGYPEDAERWAAPETIPPLPRAFLDDLERLLEACDRSGVALWPSLASFEAFFPIRERKKGVTSGGRGAWLRAPGFFDAVLEPILEVAERHRGALAAFEICNEPGWAVDRGWKGGPRGAHPPWIEEGALGAWLVDGARRVARRELRASIGFVDAAVPWLPPSHRTTLRRLAGSGRYVHQTHHYPKPDGRRLLPPADRSPILPCWVGELPTSRARRWFDDGLAEDDDDAYLGARLAHAAALGYEGALLWAARAKDRQVRWDAATRARVRAFAADAG